MDYAHDMSSDVMICTPSLVEIGSGSRKLLGGYTYWHPDAQAANSSHKPDCIVFFKMRKVDSTGFRRWRRTLRITGLLHFVRGSVFYKL
jgi:hypothetical protein